MRQEQQSQSQLSFACIMLIVFMIWQFCEGLELNDRIEQLEQNDHQAHYFGNMNAKIFDDRLTKIEKEQE